VTFKTNRRAFGYVQPDWEKSTSPIKVTVVYGQSRADNHSEGTAWCYYPRTTNERVLMMNNPRAPGRAFQGPFDPVTATNLITLADCEFGSFADPGGHSVSSRDPLGQSLATALWYLDAQDVAHSRALRRRALVVAGEGGQKIATLSKGAAAFVGTNGPFVIYDRMIAMVNRAKALALAIYGQSIEVESILWLQGEADWSTAQATYYSALKQIITDMTTDLVAITGQSYTPPFLLDQVPAKSSDGTGNPAALAQLQVALENANGHTYLVGPTQGMPFNTRDSSGATAHMPSQAVMAHGEHFGVAREKLIESSVPDLCYVNGYSLVGSTLTLTAHVPQGSLTTDTDIPAPTNKGFVLNDPGGATISSVTVGSNTITIALSQAPAAGASIEYAYNASGGVGSPAGVTWASKLDLQGDACSTAGAWGNIRDARADACTQVTGYTLHNFLCSFKQTIA
jgi:hypothetical protein